MIQKIRSGRQKNDAAASISVPSTSDAIKPRKKSHAADGIMRAFSLCICRERRCFICGCGVSGGRQQKSWSGYLYSAGAAAGVELLGILCGCNGRCIRL